jgi:hypothetical protein
VVVGLLLLAVIVGVVVTVVRRSGAGTSAGPGAEGTSVRRFFHYLLLFGLFVVVASGLAGLLGRLLQRPALAAGDDLALARDLAFVVVGGPLLVTLALWARRELARDADEARSTAWAAYVTAASLTSLLLAMSRLDGVLRWATGLHPYDGAAVAGLIVWGGAWAAHWWLDRRVTSAGRSRVHHLAGSLVGLVVAATGLGRLLAAALRPLLGLSGTAVLASADRALVAAVVTLAVGAPVWIVYWQLTWARSRRDPLWIGYVLLAGVAGGLVTAIGSASTLLHTVLVWLVGDPRSTVAAVHFRSAPTSAAAAVVGTLIWWYHHAVLESAGVAAGRSEVRRVYEYLMAAIGLLAAAAGLVTLLASLGEAAAGRPLAGAGAVNTLLAAVTLIVVGGPVWWVYWRRIRSAAVQAPAAELASPTRRLYLFVLFGVGGVAAVVALIVGVYLLFEDMVRGTAGSETLRRMRFPVGIVVTTAAISAYHWAVYREDRRQLPAVTEARGPGYVLLLGPAGPAVATEVAHRTRGRVQSWSLADGGPPGATATWSADDVMAALDGVAAEEVVVLAEGDGLRVIPVHRG